MSIVERSPGHFRLAIHHGLKAFRITGTVDLNFRESFGDLMKIFRTHFDVGASEIFLQALQFGSSGDRDNPGLLGQQPCERNLRAGCVLTVSDVAESLNDPLIRF